MSPLSPEQIKALLAKPEKAARAKSGSGKTIDTSVRDYQTWFKLAHEIFNKEEMENDLVFLRCENPECLDPRDHESHSQVVAMVNSHYMCRLCFLDGWLVFNPDQLPLSNS